MRIGQPFGVELVIFDQEVLETAQGLNHMLLQLVLHNADHRLVVESRFHFVLSIVAKHLEEPNEELCLVLIERRNVRDLQTVADALAYALDLLGEQVHSDVQAAKLGPSDSKGLK